MMASVNENDPRVRRTRQLLLKAFDDLVREGHGISPISVQAIAERATVNRATFYAHFDNKFALVETWARTKFQRAVRSQLPPSSTLQRDTLRELILVVFDFMAAYRRYVKPRDEQLEPLFEIAMQQELQAIFAAWLHRLPAPVRAYEGGADITAMVISWAIFGSAMQWSREAERCSAEEMARQVSTIVDAALSPVATID